MRTLTKLPWPLRSSNGEIRTFQDAKRPVARLLFFFKTILRACHWEWLPKIAFRLDDKRPLTTATTFNGRVQGVSLVAKSIIRSSSGSARQESDLAKVIQSCCGPGFYRAVVVSVKNYVFPRCDIPWSRSTLLMNH